ncbi:branched-chain amino acid ABC transporter permease [Variovorax sp. J22G21]|uniref:branched-chain amino acid ABC transporter permease n=1 Tax=Variovorax fucosicus TaxID=3053517 RepID=UPI0025765776|nr:MULTISPECIES: branched-chain amino acid ABC transporter permease [unclassified Variovorax]MDM0037466.1 branched-chain amino acid ABC transporter permease [Variovorax sp. J22R193]MDM0056872.1 branched-chain amino acid ABC transporter permease [Variovorax sp. J22G47]MDM0062242.1 branched-chain amino acid ABC transporter permease [Variovorax sp. J22G21]
MIPDSVRRERRAARLSLARMVLFLLALGALLPWIANAYWIKTLTSSLALAIAAAGVSLLYGQLGLVSLCQFALLGAGGWVALRVGHGLQWPFEACVLAGGLSAGVLGMLAGLPALRLKGIYLALVTLMLAGGFQVVVSATGFPDGGPGWLGRITGSERLVMPRPAMAQGEGAYLTYVAAWLAAMLAVIELHRRTRAGRSWALIRRGEAVAEGAGVNVLLYQTWAFGLAGVCTGVAGALLAGAVGQLDGRAFAASESVMLFALTLIGGAHHWAGALVAGLLLRAVPSMLVDLGVNGYLAMIFFGAALLHALITAPRGIVGQWIAAISRLRARKRAP